MTTFLRIFGTGFLGAAVFILTVGAVFAALCAGLLFLGGFFMR